MNTDQNVAAVYAEESDLYAGRLLITTVFADGSTVEKHLSGSVARRYLRTQRARISQGQDR